MRAVHIPKAFIDRDAVEAIEAGMYVCLKKKKKRKIKEDMSVFGQWTL